MKLSILDQAPVLIDQKSDQALSASLQLAKAGDELGYERYWIAEHHDMDHLACSAPEVMLSYIGSQTNRIRLGSGATLLPHYKPYKVAELYHMLSTLFPGRIDLGIGRAPGGSPESSIALSGNFLEQVRQFPDDVGKLLHFIYQDFPEDDFFKKVKASPLPPTSPVPWLLGTSEKSAVLAAENGMRYVFGQFMSELGSDKALSLYKSHFHKKREEDSPETIVTVEVICAETDEKAETLAAQSYKWRNKEDSSDSPSPPNMIKGSPESVTGQLKNLSETSGADEIMILTITPTYESRLESYRLIAKHALQ
ncbi:LLM class flavin-dependent oxidoreductase [Sediminibacillus massiliensis]|uniref:LLM class flavin-dependent oxidoreductase n=1 Tax=Sediminibacillus massiliensis TaxID=1926277 RepID=UPI00098852F6|nr:LLM class flavin-dependent oxidoreductase [Sediminibacillus massiliensis]